LWTSVALDLRSQLQAAEMHERAHLHSWSGPQAAQAAAEAREATSAPSPRHQLKQHKQTRDASNARVVDLSTQLENDR
jgi:hypothetical protein